MIYDELNKQSFADLCEEHVGEHINYNVSVGPFDHENGYLSLIEVWTNELGQTDRAFGPAIIHRDPQSGEVFWQEWWSNGKLHREDGPAIIIEDIATGDILDQRYYHHSEQIYPSLGKAPKLDL